MRLPEHFLIGAATAAHQVEGNNIRSDLWAMEHMKHTSFLARVPATTAISTKQPDSM